MTALPVSPLPLPRTREARILVVDDSSEMQALNERILGRDGHRVVLAGDGRAALRALKSEAFDLVLTDLFMPDMDGIELIREIKTHAPETPVIVLSGADLTECAGLLRAAVVFGATTTLRKPISPGELQASVRSALALPADLA